MTTVTMNAAFNNASAFNRVGFVQAPAGWLGAANNVAWTASIAVRLAAAAVPFAMVCAIFTAV